MEMTFGWKMCGTEIAGDINGAFTTVLESAGHDTPVVQVSPLTTTLRTRR